MNQVDCPSQELVKAQVKVPIINKRSWINIDFNDEEPILSFQNISDATGMKQTKLVKMLQTMKFLDLDYKVFGHKFFLLDSIEIFNVQISRLLVLQIRACPAGSVPEGLCRMLVPHCKCPKTGCFGRQYHTGYVINNKSMCSKESPTLCFCVCCYIQDCLQSN